MTENKRKICVVTGSRAEYGLLYWLMREINGDAGLKLQLIVTGMHLAPEFGLTYKSIEDDGFAIDKKIEMSLSGDTSMDATKAVGKAVVGFADAYNELRPDIVVVLGDRFEIFAAATAATIARIPIAHIHGGESTEGAFDESFRHAITKMSLVHFTAAEAYRKRIVQMGESPDRVFCVGAPGLEHTTRTDLLSKEDLERSIEFEFGKPTFLIAYHSVTLEDKSSEKNFSALLSAVDNFPEARIIFTQSNADPDNRVIWDLINKKAANNSDRMAVYTNLGYKLYLSVLKYVDVVIGNSSSGIIEVPAFKKPTVNIGDRQKGRLLADSVINCREDAEEIKNAITKALSFEFQRSLDSVVNPYGAGNTSVRIKNILKEIELDENCLKKRFYDFPQ